MTVECELFGGPLDGTTIESQVIVDTIDVPAWPAKGWHVYRLESHVEVDGQPITAVYVYEGDE